LFQLHRKLAQAALAVLPHVAGRDVPAPSIGHTSLEHAVTLQTPEAEGDVTDPLIVRGAIHATANPVDYELMIDETPIANFNDEAVSRVKGSELEMRVPVPFLTEGAHLLWTRCTAAGSAGSPREVYFWR
jgi:hypothetical protein